MNSTRSLREWRRFLEASSAEDAAAELGRQISQIDAVYDEVAALVPGFFNCPDSDVPAALGWARSSLSEAAGLLETIRGRLNSDDCEVA